MTEGNPLIFGHFGCSLLFVYKLVGSQPDSLLVNQIPAGQACDELRLAVVLGVKVAWME